MPCIVQGLAYHLGAAGIDVEKGLLGDTEVVVGRSQMQDGITSRHGAPEADPIADVATHEGCAASLRRWIDQVAIDDLVARGEQRGVTMRRDKT